MDIVALDISGRHAVGGRYLMLCAAVSARISPDSLEKVYEIKQLPKEAESLDLNTVTDLISTASRGLIGVILAERGDLYNLESWRVESILGRPFKYPESLGERLAIELAHHISLSGRRLIFESQKRYL